VAVLETAGTVASSSHAIELAKLAPRLRTQIAVENVRLQPWREATRGN
jgi:hypothetical protein